MFDTRAFLRHHCIPFLDGQGHHHARGGWAQIQNCPFCGGRNHHFGMSLTEERTNCWRCGPHSLWAAIGAFLRTEDKGAIGRTLKQFSGLKTALPPRQKARKTQLPEPPGCTPLQPAHKQYLQSRNFDPDTLESEWDLRATTHTGDRWAWRIIAPIKDGGRTVAYQGRAIGPTNHVRYYTTPDADCLIDPKTLLYGIDEVPGNTVIVVEGITGVWRLGPGAVATLGIGWHRQQANRLRKFRKISIFFDPEPLAQKRARGLAEHLALFGGETEILSGFPTDPGDLGDKAAELVREAVGL